MDITPEDLRDMIADLGEDLQEIIHESVPCDRMAKYLHGSRKDRLDLNHNIPMGHFSDDQHHLILQELMDMMPEKDNESMEVVLKVLFLETPIRLYQKITRKSYKEAEEELFQGKVRSEIIKGISCFF